ncbi:polysaccharide pyruvyl transferase family protein [Aequorivita marina]|uniref:polysaccharide pyruvyl transferase family protein n=1 Tax=Aequorivita marina TaxID=3073654 RepID=UPI002876B814|nr:polysaccharide pyruvyl transferase family protein [Aequorivita sp. S2608]MDS1299059.1 polysaccharide pyruvyl transferase family protein [Aequorivita sp. S2608]
MKIFIFGQSTVHWGRVEFGNIGNYYIVEPAIRMLHRTFPQAKIKTTLQLSKRFCSDENIEVVPMEWYYGFNEQDLPVAQKEYRLALNFNNGKPLPETTPFMDAVLEADLIIDFSGDIWGDNADFLGENRFLVGLYKDRTAQLLGKKTVMMAGSPGPFSPGKNLDFAKEVFKNFDLVTNRESYSRNVLEEYGFNLDKLKDLSCPSFLFEAKKDFNPADIHPLLDGKESDLVVGLILCGWNFPTQAFDTTKRSDSDYDFLVTPLIKFLDENKKLKLCLMSHSNGFNPGEEPFRLLQGRDYENIKQLEDILIRKGYENRIFALNDVYDPWTTKAIIGNFDMLISGRIHGAVAGLSQGVPTVIIDYGNGPEAHKLKGFAKEAEMLEYVANPNKTEDIYNKITDCILNLKSIKEKLDKQIPIVKEKSKQNFELLKEILK